MFGSSLSCLTILVYPRARLYDSTCLQFSFVHKFYHAHCSYDVTLIFATYIKTMSVLNLSCNSMLASISFRPLFFFFFQIFNRLSMLLSFAKCYFPLLIQFVLLVCITFLLKHAFLYGGGVYNRGWAPVGRRGRSSSYSGSPSPRKVSVCYFLFKKRIPPTRYLTLLILSNYNSYLGDQGVVAQEGNFYPWMVSLLFI